MTERAKIVLWSIWMTLFGIGVAMWAESYFVTEPIVFWFRVGVALCSTIVLTLGFGPIKEKKEEP